ncbi:Meiotic nuclear division protein 1, partial [Ilyodon furcidens]
KDVFQLKDIEKIAPKSKGIAPMTVKEVLQSLVDDNMVDCERVGTSNYYWAFPSKALHARKHKLEELQKQVRADSFCSLTVESTPQTVQHCALMDLGHYEILSI